MTPESVVAVPKERLESLDVLRGLDIIFLIGLQPLLMAIFKVWDIPGEAFLREQLSHRSWMGFSCWDLVMPLFVFMSGITLPFSLSKHRGEGWKRADLWLRLFRRVAILWIFGGIVQGNFLALDFGHIRLYSNTLQAIAAGTLIAFPVVLLCSVRKQIAVIAALLGIYWLVFMCFGDDSYATGANIAETIDNAVLGRFRDGATLTADGIVRFSPHYHYTWILSSLGFGATMLLGAQAGNILRSTQPAVAKIRILSMCGFSMVIFGWLLHLVHPVIKPLWTSSMVLVSAGYCFLMMMFFYWLIDLRKVRKPFEWVKIVGCNALLAYILAETHLFNGTVNALTFGLKRHLGDAYAVVPPLVTFGLIWLLLWLLYRQKLFLRA